MTGSLAMDVADARTSADGAELLASLAQRHVDARVTNVERRVCSPKARPDLCKVRVVTAVAESGPAALLGISAGDHFIGLDEADGASEFEAPMEMLHLVPGKHLYSFYLSCDTLLTFSAEGVVLGIKLERTTEAIVAAMEAGWKIEQKEEDLLLLWNRGEDQALLRIARRVFPERSLGRLATLANRLHNYTFASWLLRLLCAAALYEAGEEDRAMEHFKKIAKVIGKYTSEFTSLWGFYCARHTMRTNQALGVEGVLDALVCGTAEAMPRIARYAAKLHAAGVCPPPEQVAPRETFAQLPAGAEFPVDYRLEGLRSSRGAVVLADALEAMKPHQVFAVVFLGEYRANGPYAVELCIYDKLQRLFGEVLAGAHVIVNGDGWGSHWIPEEEAVLEDEGFLRVGVDPSCAIASCGRLAHSPHVVWLNKRKQLLAPSNILESSSSVHVWELFAEHAKILVQSPQ